MDPGTARPRPVRRPQAFGTAWQVAWRLRRSVLPASVLPFLYMVAVDWFEPLLFEVMRGAELAFYVTDMLYFAGDALFLAMLLDAFFARGAVAAGLAAFLPSRNALRLAVLTLPLGLAVSLLHQVMRTGLGELMLRLAADGTLPEPEPLIRFVTDLIVAPGMQICLAGLVFAPIAVRLLELPVLVRPVRTFPDLGLVAMLLLSLAIAMVLQGGATGVLAVAPLIGETAVPSYAAWYIGVFSLLTLTASAVAALLQRRSARPSH